jgi:hypothetical protein
MRFRYIDDDPYRPFMVFKMTPGRTRPRAPEHDEMLRQVRKRQVEAALRRSTERRRAWGLPELGYRPPTA